MAVDKKPPDQSATSRHSIWQDGQVTADYLDGKTIVIPQHETQRRKVRQLLQPLFPPEAPRGRVILDLGCGGGDDLARILVNFPQATGVAVDYSPGMVAAARKRLKRFDRRALIVEADLTRPSFWEMIPQVDAVVSAYAIHHLTDQRKRALFAEIYDRLPPGGIFINRDHVLVPPTVMERFFNIMTAELCRKHRLDQDAFAKVRENFISRPDRAANILATVDVQCAMLRDIGYRDVKCHWQLPKAPALAIFAGIK